jgi:putative ABC transport system ATP-binding protein
MTIISIRNINKTYAGKGFEVNALADVSLEIDRGIIVGVVGPSGSGKSTLLNIIGLIDTPTSGEYYINDVLTSEYSMKQAANIRNKTFGFVLQDFALIERYTVAQNVQIPLVYSDVPKREWRGRIDDVLSKVGIMEKRRMMPAHISGGQRQRVAIARALVNNPLCILADEPTGSLDTNTGEEIMNLFVAIKKEGKSVIVVTHDHKIAERCDQLYEIVDGRIRRKA